MTISLMTTSNPPMSNWASPSSPLEATTTEYPASTSNARSASAWVALSSTTRTRVRIVPSSDQFHQTLRHFVDREYRLHDYRRDRLTRHPIDNGARLILREDERRVGKEC